MGWPGVDDGRLGPCADAQGTGDDGALGPCADGQGTGDSGGGLRYS